MKTLTHVDSANNPTMVDVSHKVVTERVATASGVVYLPKEVQAAILGGEIQTKKGPVLTTAIIAGTQAVKQTSQLIPFCHPLAIESIKFNLEFIKSDTLKIDCTVKISGKTGVEMEALTGVSVAALTVYDMCKALSHEIVISDIQLVAKSGGKSKFQRGEGCAT